MKALIADDEVQLADALTQILKKNNIDADAAYDGQEAYYKALSGVYDVIILDIMMPKMDGITLLKKLREEKIDAAILMLSAKSEVSDRILGLDSGADDYLTKPFSTQELLARVRAAARRNSTYTEDKLSIEDVVLDRSKSELSKSGRTIVLGAKELQIMEMLILNKGNILSKERFMEKIWGYDSDAEYNAIEVYISFLRKKLKAVQSEVQIKSVRGLGYRLEK